LNFIVVEMLPGHLYKLLCSRFFLQKS